MVRNDSDNVRAHRNFTNGVFDAQTIELSLCQATPDFRLIDLRGIVVPTINADNVLDEDIADRIEWVHTNMYVQFILVLRPLTHVRS